MSCNLLDVCTEDLCTSNAKKEETADIESRVFSEDSIFASTDAADVISTNNMTNANSMDPISADAILEDLPYSSKGQATPVSAKETHLVEKINYKIEKTEDDKDKDTDDESGEDSSVEKNSANPANNRCRNNIIAFVVVLLVVILIIVLSTTLSGNGKNFVYKIAKYDSQHIAISHCIIQKHLYNSFFR